jgi:site-specific DNA-methyltransferase (adenine-specific)
MPTKVLTIEQVAPDKLSPAAYNPRKMSDTARAALRRGIEAFGLVDPIIARRSDNLVIGGHQRLTAAKEMGLATVPVVYLDDLDDQKAAALNVLLNNPSAQGEWDFGLLSGLLSELDASGFDATLTGFDDKQLEDLLAWTPDPGEPVEEGDVDLTPPKEPESKLGEVYELGRHRVMCGDSTDEAQVATLAGEGTAECLWTDPPYGVSYVGKTKDALTIENDGADGLEELLARAFAAADSAMAPGARVYCAAPAGPRNLAFRIAMLGVGWKLHQELVWVKNAMVLGHADYHYRHEPILYGYKPGPGRVGRGKHEGTKWYGDHSQTSVLEFDKPSRSAEHPTMKPLGLIRRCLLNSTKPGDKVLDVFGGSGSTLIACEQTNRTAYLMEIDARYCDVILRRYEAFVAQKQAVA